MEILDLIAKVSWETNEKALQGMKGELSALDKQTNELRLQNKRFADQLVKTHDPKIIKRLGEATKYNEDKIKSLILTEEKRLKVVQNLKTKQDDLNKSLAKTGDPNTLKPLLTQLDKVEQKLKSTGTQAQGMASKFGGIGQSLLAGFGLGGGMMIFQTALSGIQNFVGNSIAEFEDAQKSALDLQRALHVIGKDKYFEGLKSEADDLAKTFFGLFDNDDIIKAQTALVQYGKLTRAEMSKLLPVILELATKTGDIGSATQTVINILEGRGGQTLRDYGVSVKGVKTEHDRLNIVLGDFQTKLKGSAEVYKDTAEGIAQTNKILVKNIEEQFGESFGKIKNKVLPIITGILNGVNAIISGDVNFDQGTDDWKQFKKTKAGQAANLRAQALLKGMKADVDLNKTLNPNADLSDPDAEAAAKAAAKKAEEARKKLIADRKALDAELLSLQNEFDASQAGRDAAQIGAIDEKHRKLLIKARELGHNEIELEELHQKERTALTQKFAARDLAFLNTHEEETLQQKKDAHDKEIKDLENYGARVKKILLKEAADLTEENRKRTEKKKTAEEKEREEREQLKNKASDLARQISNAYSIEINAIDSLITAQEKRVETAKNSSEKSLAIEQSRLDELVRKREKYERQQRTIDAAVIVANQAVAISAGIVGVANAVKSGNAVLIIANIAAILGGLLAGYSAVRSINAGFKEGGYTGDGDPSETSTAIGKRPYKYHKKEFVMNEQLTTKHRDMLEGMHNGHLIVNKMKDGYYLSNRTIDADAAVQDFRTSKNSTLDTSDLSALLYSIDAKLSQREVRVSNNLDVDGFSMKIATSLGRVHIENKRR